MHVLFLTTDLMASSKLESAACAAGLVARTCLSPTSLLEAVVAGDAAIVVVDLAAPQLEIGTLVESLRTLKPVPAAILAFGPHVHEAKLTQATEAGCDGVYSRGEFHARGGQILASFAQGNVG